MFEKQVDFAILFDILTENVMEDIMKILFISYHFAPENIIGALRPTKLVKYFLKNGNTVDVITSEKTDSSGAVIPDGIRNLKCIGQTKLCEKICNIPVRFAGAKTPKTTVSGSGESQTKNNNTSKSLKSEIRKNILFSFRYYHFLSFLHQFKKSLKEYKDEDYDCIYSSFGPLPSILCAMYAKKCFPKAKWICEFRDPIVVEGIPSMYRYNLQQIQNKACKKADAIVAVSQGYLDRITKGKYPSKSFMIPNGYDEDDLAIIDAEPKNSVLKITYVGSLYSGKRDLSPLFRAIRELSNEKSVDSEKIIFDYAGGDYDVVKNQANLFDVTHCLNNNGVLSRKDCIELQQKSHILVLSTWNTKGEEGVFPGKFLEYMLMKRPIVAVVDGDLANSEVKKVMNEANLGVCYEASNAETDIKELKSYIKMQYDNVVNGNSVYYNPNENVVDRYNYENIIRKIEDLIK